MPSKVVTSNTTEQVAFTTPGDKKAVIERVIISDGAATGGLITVEDYFTPAVSAGVPTPTVKTESRLVLECAGGALVDINQSEGGEGIEIFGACRVKGSTTDANIHITIVWKYL